MCGVHEQGSGVSVMEMSHRGREFMSIIAKAEQDLRTLLQIPDNYGCAESLLHVTEQTHAVAASKHHHGSQGLAATCYSITSLNKNESVASTHVVQTLSGIAFGNVGAVSLAQVLFLQGGATQQFAGVPLNLTQVGWGCGGLHCHGVMGQKGSAGGREICQGQHRGQGRQQIAAGAQRLEAEPQRQVRALLRQ